MPLLSGLPYPLLSPFASFDSFHLIDKKGALYFLFKAFVWWQPYPVALLFLDRNYTAMHTHVQRSVHLSALLITGVT
jgi:hypothetical protein